MAVYVDDTLGSGNPKFEQLTEKIPKTFESKKKEYPPYIFAGINVNNTDQVYFL